MEEKPTVQMDPFSFEGQDAGSGDNEDSKTVPADEMFGQGEWPSPPSPAEYSTPTPPPAAQPGFVPAYGEPASGQAQPAGATVIMGPPAAPPLLAWLAVVKGPGAQRGQVHTLQRETIIGRTAGQVVLPGDGHVSSEHAKVRLEKSEDDDQHQMFVLYDLASTNHTFAGSRDDYEDTQIYRHVLRDGDFILVGETTLVFKQV
jgi:hypothetical protein